MPRRPRGDRRIRRLNLVTQAHGLDASQYTFNYVAGWALEAAGRSQDTLSIDQVVRNTGERVIAAAHRILSHTQPATDPAARGAHADTVALGPAESPAWETLASSGRLHAETMAGAHRPVGRQMASPAR